MRLVIYEVTRCHSIRYTKNPFMDFPFQGPPRTILITCNHTTTTYNYNHKGGEDIPLHKDTFYNYPGLDNHLIYNILRGTLVDM